MTEFVILDTNAWIHGTRLLRSPLGVAFLHAARDRKAILRLPEVVETELLVVLSRECQQHSSQITRAVSEIESFLGRRFPPLPLPSESDVASVLRERLVELAPMVERVPLSIDHARAALNRVVNRLAPADRTEEYRDAMIWEVVRETSAHGKTFFVTSDKAFYNERSFDKGPAAQLQADRSRIYVSPDLQQYLSSVNPSGSKLSETAIVSLLDNATRNRLEYQVPESRQYLELTSLIRSDVSRFLTDTPDVVVCTFKLEYTALYAPDSQEEPYEATFGIAGEAFLRVDSTEVIALEFNTSWLDDNPSVAWGTHRFGTPDTFNKLPRTRYSRRI